MAGDGVLLVNFGTLSQAGADITKGISSLQSQLDDLERSAAPLVNTWEGEAKEAYAVRQARWQQASTELTQILTNIRQALQQSADDYTSTEKQATSRFQ